MENTDIVVAVDLEMNQPSGKIIEVGYTIGNKFTGQVLVSKGIIVKIDELLNRTNPDIVKLTSITDEMVQAGRTLQSAYEELTADCHSLGAHRQPVEWGGGDIRTLRQQIWEIDKNILANNWSFGYTTMNIKNIVQGILNAKKLKTQGGLARSLGKFGLSFKGTKHRAIDDSLNTFLLYVELLKRLEPIQVKG